MLPEDLSKLLKKAYSLDRKAEKIATAEKAIEELTRQQKGKTKSKAKKEQSDDAQLVEKPDEGS